jgi:hypothetical protein
VSTENVQYALAAAEVFASDAPPRAAEPLDALGAELLGEFARAEQARRPTEERWLRDLRQYRGQYDPDVTIDKNRSRAFVRKTRVKVKTLDSRVADLLFPAGSQKNWTVEPTPKPSLSQDQRREALAPLAQALGREPSREEAEKAITEWAKQRSKAMAKTIDDQLVEAGYKGACLKAIHSAHLYGTGIVKGPLVERKVRERFIKHKGKWVSRAEAYVTPWVDFVPLWRFYPDLTSSALEGCRFVYERHQMSKHELAKLALRKSFNGQRIRDYIRSHPSGQVQLRWVDSELRTIGDRDTLQGDQGGNYEVLERWGYLDGEKLRQAGVRVPDDRVHESFFSNVWMLPDGQIIKAVLQPINGVVWPYHIYSFDQDESSIFAEGLAAIMRDAQDLINASTRLMVDNAAISGGPMFEIATELLSTYERSDEVHPFKAWKRKAGQNPGQRAVQVIDIPSHVPELNQMAQRFDLDADEVTAIPRYMTGENANSGAAGTASGMSMLLGAANIVIKDLVSAWDEGITQPFISALYRWNMQFHSDDGIKGDFDVKASGAASLVAKEVRAKQLVEFAGMVANPVVMPFVKFHRLLQLIAEANELSDVVKTEDEVKAEQNNAQTRQIAELQQQSQALQLQEMQGKVAKLAADTQKAMADVALVQAKAVESKVSAAYAAMQAGGVATQTPHVAPAGDEILRSAGWTDATPSASLAQVGGQPVQPVAQPAAVPPQTGEAGAHAGIETALLEGVPQ